MPRKSLSFGQLLAYVNAPAAKGAAILQNFRTTSDDPPRLEAELLENARPLPRRRNGNVLYHEVLSFSRFDRSRVTEKVLADLTHRYLALRAPYALAYAKAHFDTACPHVHLLVSANNLGEARRIRLTRRHFDRIKRQLEEYQLERYPELAESTAQQRRRCGPKHTRREEERELRLKRGGERPTSRKDAVRDLVLRELTGAPSGPDCYRRLKARGLLLYRRGQSIGVEDIHSSRRYLLKTLGLAETFARSFAQWRELPDRLRSLADLDLTKARDRWQELGFRDEIRIVLEPAASGEGLPTQHRDRLHELARLTATQNRHHRQDLGRDL